MSRLETFLEAGRNEVLYDADYFEVRSIFIPKDCKDAMHLTGAETIEDYGDRYRVYYLQCVKQNRDFTVPQPIGMTAANYMFYDLSFGKLDLSSWDMSEVKTIWNMFSSCNCLVSLDIDNWDVSSCENLDGAFEGCTLLKALDFSNWDTRSVKSMYRTFSECILLEELTLGKWNFGSIDLDSAFCRCVSLSLKYSKALPIMESQCFPLQDAQNLLEDVKKAKDKRSRVNSELADWDEDFARWDRLLAEENGQ